MERRMKISLLRIVGAAVLAFAFLVCSNPIDIVQSVTTEVKVANNKFLAVTSVNPTADSTVSPGSSVWIKFDRSIDLSTVNSGTIVFSPAVTWDSPAFDTATRTLTITPMALEGGTKYTVTVTNSVRGSDGSELQSDQAWNFTTRLEPGGTFKIQSPATDPPHVDGYTKTTGVTIAVTSNSLVNEVHVRQVGGTDLGWLPKAATYNLTLTSGDGVKTVEVQFNDSSLFETTPVAQTVMLDTAPPSAGAMLINSGNGYTNTTGVTLTNSATDGSGSGLSLMRFYEGSWTAWEAYSASKAWTLSTGDATKTVYVQVSDKAGWTSTTASDSIILDTVAPTAPVVTAPSTPGTGMPTYSWVSGGGGDVGIYRYKVGSAAWSTETTGTSHAPSSLPDFGANYLYVQERDAAGNWSLSGSNSYFWYPTWLQPAHTATGVSKTPLVVFGPDIRYIFTKWELWVGPSSTKLDLYTTVTGSSPSYQVPAATPLPGSAKLYWRYKTYDTRYPKEPAYVSPVYSFMTRP